MGASYSCRHTLPSVVEHWDTRVSFVFLTFSLAVGLAAFIPLRFLFLVWALE